MYPFYILSITLSVDRIQNADNTIVGYQRPEALTQSKTPTILRIYFNKEGKELVNRVVRIPLKGLIATDKKEPGGMYIWLGYVHVYIREMY